MTSFFGGLISSLVKRDRIETANRYISEISQSVTILNKELEDVNMSIPTEISNTFGDKFFDIWFDNIFTDIRVQTEIGDTLEKIKDFRVNIEELIKKLDNEIENYTK